jgi:hypothetical protein
MAILGIARERCPALEQIQDGGRGVGFARELGNGLFSQALSAISRGTASRWRTCLRRSGGWPRIARSMS